MKNYSILIAAFCLTHFVQMQSFAQGCSDAGFCTISSLKPNANGSGQMKEKNQVKLGLSYGVADFDIDIFSQYVEFNHQFSSKIQTDIRLTGISQSGNGINSFGISDIMVSGTYASGKHSSILLGAKIPLMNANSQEANKPLPMDYQSSLGTFDLILGFNYRYQKLQMTLAWQQPLSQNSNQYLPELYTPGSALGRFPATNKFVRSGDILFRASYPFQVSKSFSITPGLLPIYHLMNDRYTTLAGVEKDIDGSAGLTLNANVFADWQLTKRSSLQFNLGVPLIVRDTRPDGLTRKFITTVEYGFRF